MALLFQGAAFCPSCGAARSRAEEAQPHTTKCPACRGDMHWIRVGDVDLLECASCDGTWIEAAAFDRLCTRARAAGRDGAQGDRIEGCRRTACAGRASCEIPALPSVRKDDEPAELRPALRHHRRCLQRTWNVSGSRRAASGREVHPRRRIQPHAPGRAGPAEGRDAAGCASWSCTSVDRVTTGAALENPEDSSPSLRICTTELLAFRDAQRLPPRARIVFREQHNLADVRGVM